MIKSLKKTKKGNPHHTTIACVCVNKIHLILLCFLCGKSFFDFPHYLFFLEDKTISNAKEQLINEAIRVPQVRVIANDGEQLGILKTQDALRIAYDKGLDLVMVAAQSDPPVCKIIDYGKYCFERDKREKEAKKKQTVIEIKELQLTCKIGQHDIDTKLKHARRFIGDGNKVRIIVKYQGREMQHTEIGVDLLNSFLSSLSDIAAADKQPVLEGRNLTVTISPIKK